jgi:DNA-binding NarL/FixJ family response regulator
MQSKLLVVEDHPLYAEALQRAISHAIVGVHTVIAPTIASAIEVLGDGTGIDLVILDLRLPDSNGLDGLIEIKAHAPCVPVIVTSAFADTDVINNVIVCGAAAFVSKSCETSVLMREISAILEGKKYTMSSFALNRHKTSEVVKSAIRSGALTRQQMRVLKLLCKGLLNKQIAHGLGINESTVKAHVSEILRKLRVASRTQAVVAVSHLSDPVDMHSTVPGE